MSEKLYTKAEILKMIGEDKEKNKKFNAGPDSLSSYLSGYNQAKQEIREKLK